MQLADEEYLIAIDLLQDDTFRSTVYDQDRPQLRKIRLNLGGLRCARLSSALRLYFAPPDAPSPTSNWSAKRSRDFCTDFQELLLRTKFRTDADSSHLLFWTQPPADIKFHLRRKILKADCSASDSLHRRRGEVRKQHAQQSRLDRHVRRTRRSKE